MDVVLSYYREVEYVASDDDLPDIFFDENSEELFWRQISKGITLENSLNACRNTHTRPLPEGQSNINNDRRD